MAGTLPARLLTVAGGVGASVIVARRLGAEGLGALSSVIGRSTLAAERSHV